MSETRIASRYALALYERAIESKSLEKVVADIRKLNEISAQNQDFVGFLHSPLISKDEKTQVLNKIFALYHAETQSLFKLMVTKNRESLISIMGVEFVKIYNKNNGITEAVVTTASALDSENLEKIEHFVKANTGANAVQIHTKTDPSLVGGLTIMFDGRIYDSSISSQIKKIKKELKIA